LLFFAAFGAVAFFGGVAIDSPLHFKSADFSALCIQAYTRFEDLMNIFRRRAFLLLAAIPTRAARKEPEERVPTEPLPLNAFAAAYNRYTTQLRDGVIDVKQWARVIKEWHRLVG
jgi:hypothetical protein